MEGSILNSAMARIIQWMRNGLAYVHFESWYGLAMTVVAAIASELVFSWIIVHRHYRENREKVQARAAKRMKDRDMWPGELDDDWDDQWEAFCHYLRNAEREKSKAWKKEWKSAYKTEWKRIRPANSNKPRDLFRYLVAYLVFMAIAVLAFAWARKVQYHQEFGKAFLGSLKLFLSRYWVEMVIAPFSVAAVKILDHCVPQWVRRLAIILLFLILVFAPFLVSYQSVREGLESLLLTQYKQMPYPFVTRYYDPDGMAYRVSKGYWAKEETQEEKEKPELPMTDPATMSFVELVEAADKCMALKNEERERLYIDAAYTLYQNGQAIDKEGKAATYQIGLMWFIKGFLDKNADYYMTGGNVYKESGDLSNAIVCYLPAYDLKPLNEYADLIIDTFLAQTDPKDNNEFNQFICRLLAYHAGDIPRLEELRSQFPENLAILLASIMQDIRKGRFGIEDYDALEPYLSDGQHDICPKILLLRAYWEGDNHYQEIYEEFLKWDYVFEPEDMVNLAWMLYLDGEYEKTYQVLASARGEALFYQRLGYNDDDAQKWADSVIADGHYLAAEVFLQGTSLNINGNSILDTLEKTSFDGWYSDNDLIRISLTEALMDRKLGRGYNQQSIQENARELVDGITYNQAMILATVDYETGNYADSLERCRNIEAFEMTDAEEHQFLFLKSDVLVALATETNDVELRAAYLTEAEKAMISVREAVEGDYLESLRKLLDIYDQMGGHEEDVAKINDILQAFE